MSKKYLIMGFGMLVAMPFGVQSANAETADAGESAPKQSDDGSGVLEKNPAGKDLSQLVLSKDRKEMDFLLKPGSGWITQGVPPLVLGIPPLIYGALAMSWPVIGAPFLASGLVLTASGAIMIGVGDTKNDNFVSGESDYVSPADGYMTGGAINTFLGAGMIAGGAYLIHYNEAVTGHRNLGISMVTIGSAYAAYGIGFFAYGLTTNFEKEAGKQAGLKKVASSLTPFVGCTGGMCDGNTNRATGRETYFGGIRGEF